jgi:hypothetical protein
MLKEAAEEQAEEQLGLWRAADRGQLRRVQQLVEQVRRFRKINFFQFPNIYSNDYRVF